MTDALPGHLERVDGGGRLRVVWHGAARSIDARLHMTMVTAFYDSELADTIMALPSKAARQGMLANIRNRRGGEAQAARVGQLVMERWAARKAAA